MRPAGQASGLTPERENTSKEAIPLARFQNQEAAGETGKDTQDGPFLSRGDETPDSHLHASRTPRHRQVRPKLRVTWPVRGSPLGAISGASASRRAPKNTEQNHSGSVCCSVILTERGSASKAEAKNRKPTGAGREKHMSSSTCAVKGQTGGAQPRRVHVTDQEPTYKTPEISHKIR